MSMERIGGRSSALLALLALLTLPLVNCGSSDGNGTNGTPANCGCQMPGAAGVPGSTPSGLMNAAEVALCEEVFAQVNAERAARGIAPIAWHAQASDVAYNHSVYQESIGTITHDGPGACAAPTDCLKMRIDAGGIVGYSAWGENVARGQATAQEVMCGAFGWMNSTGHCENILRTTFTHIGMAVKTGGAGGPYWTQVFLRIP